MKTKNRYFIFLVAYLAYSCVYICRVHLSVAEPAMEAAKMLTKSQYGLLGSVFFIAYAFGQLLNGYVGDKIVPRAMVTVGLGMMGICNLLLACLPPYPGIVILWLINGYAQSMVWGPLLREISYRFEHKYKKRVASLLISSVGTGSVIGILLATLMLAKFQISVLFMVPGILALVVAVLVLWTFDADIKECTGTLPLPLHMVLMLPQVRRILVPAMLHGVLKDNIVMWAPVFFWESYQIDLSEMSFFALLVPLIGLVGRLIYPSMLRLCQENERIVSQRAFGICICVLLPLYVAQPPAWLAAICLCVVSAAISLVNTAMLSGYPIRFQHLGNISSVAGLIDFSTYLGAGVSSAIYGVLLAFLGYRTMFASWAFISVVAIFLLQLLERKNT